MRLRAGGETLIERAVARTNLAPLPLLHTQLAFTLARVIMAATRLGIFDALAERPLAPAAVAQRCCTDPHATGKLLFALAGAGYVHASGEEYALTPLSRRWLTSSSPHCIADKLLFQFIEWEWMEHAEEYVRDGRPIALHDTLGAEGWRLYQAGMRAIASAAAPELARRLPVPAGARDLLDIGGSHGHHSVALCRRHEGLRAVVLELPEAIEHAAALLAAEGMGDRVVHRAGDALSDDLGSEAFDVVILVSLAHHLSEQSNRELAGRVARALRPGGIYAIVDAFRPERPGQAGQAGALLEFYFALTSESGTWTPQEMAAWQRAAGLAPRRPIRSRIGPGFGAQVAVKRR